MAILIEGIKMPVYGGIIFRIDEKGEVYVYNTYPTKLHKAFEIPEPHGDLIDREAFRREMDLHYPFDKATQSKHGWEDEAKSAIIMMLAKAPTVIPASEVAPDINAAHKTMEETPEIQHVGYDDAQLGRNK